jgi:hypothetical protein
MQNQNERADVPYDEGGDSSWGGGVFAAAAKVIVAIVASLESEARPALPSNTKGPMSFLGVIGPSTPVKASAKEAPKPFGLGVRVMPRSVSECGCPRRAEMASEEAATAFLEIMLTGGTVALEISWGCESPELEGDGESPMFI